MWLREPVPGNHPQEEGKSPNFTPMRTNWRHARFVHLQKKANRREAPELPILSLMSDDAPHVLLCRRGNVAHTPQSTPGIEQKPQVNIRYPQEVKKVLQAALVTTTALVPGPVVVIAQLLL